MSNRLITRLQNNYNSYQVRQAVSYHLHIYIKTAENVEVTKEYTMEQVQRKISFNLTKEVYNKLNIDSTKCYLYKELSPADQLEESKDEAYGNYSKKIVIQLKQNQTIQGSNYEEYVQQVLEHIDGRRTKFEFNKRNQLDFIQLCDIFQDPDNKEPLKESYWIIVYIHLKKIGIDISESFQNEKTKQMLQAVNINDYAISKGFLVHEPSQKKVQLQSSKLLMQIELGVFVPTAISEADFKNEHLAVNNMHNLSRVERTKGEQGLFSDYPHRYRLRLEGKMDVKLFAQRISENSEFYISLTKELPKDFLPIKKRVCQIEYDSNFFAEKPRSFRIGITDFEKGNDQNISKTFENLPPKFNQDRGCYTLNFYGRVNKASARNFQLVETDGDEDEIILSHGKSSTNEFNLDYRAPFSQVIAFGISLSAIGKKRVVG
ncbi:tubby-related protein 1 [Stylonychia lemnae]|uniref:Tubby-related protein 1 n=1 Tax=Stylonychia lemnae TaxID=5949 RepID=A0A077ZT13_STYLE|nr:tubby-related protein 1 [Stylonychia lemnae]|eukprot:CDW71606.1 tubby-related protein 1 [Stylonychia lemnae]